ncbi:hypothetical protein DSO57_1022193 [Entomophthora muscae]|uniref:Uncharacterized protein n=1 Tax=Entomophthora muscae TaxID=34485 RepID=A0ACC2SFY5_9FUNG|nr:hypothetical protein DSO57_1022193 [Entomophthora muscae]
MVSNTDPYNYSPERVHLQGKDRLFFPKKSLFDTHLYTVQGDELIGEMLNEMIYHPTSETVAREFREKISEMEQIKTIQMLAPTPHSTYFKTSKGTKVYLETTPDLGMYSGSFIHTETTSYTATKEHLMTFRSIEHGSFLGKDAPEEWLTAPLGATLVEILGTLGYDVNKNPKRERS